MENKFTFSFQTILTFLLFLSYECVRMPVFVLTARRWPLFHNSRYWRSVQGRTYYAKWWSSFPAVEIFAQCKRKQGEIKAWLSIWEQIYTKYVFCKRSHFVEDLQKILPWNKGLKKGQTLGYWTLRSNFAKYVFWFDHSFYENLKNPKWLPGGPKMADAVWNVVYQ